MKKKLVTLALGAGLVGAVNGQVLITGVVDGTQTGGNPKAIEIVATEAIANLSIYYLIRDTNGAGPFDTFEQLPSIALSTGDFYYIYGNGDSETIMTGFGFPASSSDGAETNGVANVNGDDIIGLGTPNGTFTDGSTISQYDLIDSFGQEGQGDTNFYADSYAYRPNDSAANPSGVFDAGNFTITAYSDSGLQATFGTYVVPEPSMYGAIVGILALSFAATRRRRRG
ncbi:MAG: PEP-CTERM sorting domain-containing protein [Verrucomicrobiota bacterium]